MSFRAFAALFAVTAGLLACGGGGAESPSPKSEAATPAAPPAKVEARLVTLIGSPESPGLHWIIAGDGFTASQQAELRQTALELAKELLNAPELAAHSSVWNVHLLEAESRESGVDQAAAGRYVDTAFDGRLGCGSNSRVACVDWDKVHVALLDEGAPAAELTVILNTSEYVGSSNASGIIVSRTRHAPRIAVHEMGHRVAGLADEYVDDVVAAEWMPFYFEGRFPNVTTLTDASQVPWRHWLADAVTGVGLYEGAFYASSGFYRPKQDSIMRTLEASIGEVNAEAWLRAQYRALPPVSEVSPAAGQVRGVAGQTLDFEVVSAWPRQVVSLRWFVDGSEVLGARDATTFRFTADGGDHRVEVRACDASGQIRATDAHEAESAHGWTVSPTTPPAAQKAARKPGAVSWLRMRVDAGGHTLKGWQPGAASGAANSRISSANGPDWRYTLLDEGGAQIAAGDITDPRIVRTALSAPGEPHAGHATAVLESGDYLIGVPSGVMPRKLRIAATAAGKQKLGWAGVVPAGTIELTLDVP
jgi:hypothetical protein